MRPLAYILLILNFIGMHLCVQAQIHAPVLMDAHTLFALEPTTSVCEGAAYQFAGNSELSHVWCGPNGFNSVEQNPLLTKHATLDLSGTYYVTVTSKYGSSSFKTELTVYPTLHTTITDSLSICGGESVTLMAGGGKTYDWVSVDGLSNYHIAAPVASPKITTKYSVQISNGGCSEVKEVKVTVLKPPTVNAGNDIDIETGDNIKLNGKTQGDSITYYWTPADYLDDPLSLTPIASPLSSIKYTLHVESLGGCGVATDELNVQVYPKITIANTFSPNNDGKNDTWEVANLSAYPHSILTVYNRYGGQVFRSVGGDRAWDGKLNGRPLPATAYYYILNPGAGRPVRSGWIMLLL